jgi:hypothetical protein
MFTPVKIVRFWLPAIIFVVGAAMVVISPDIIGVEGAALMLGGGLGIVVSNRIHRMGLKGERDRDAEVDARAFLDRYGVWPDEASPEILAQAERDGAIAGPAPAAEETPANSPAEPATATPPRHPHEGARRSGRSSDGPRSRRPG